jgi:Phage integrase family
MISTFISVGSSDAQAKAHYENVRETKPAALASLLNLATAMKAIQLPTKTPLDYFKEILWDESLAQDRFFGYADKSIVDQVRRAAMEHEFAPEPSPGLFHPDATSSFKQIQFGEANVQVTFHDKDTKNIGGVDCIKVEPDIEPGLVKMLAVHLGDRTGGRVFETNTGTPFCKSNVRRKLSQILKKLNLAPAGLHAFRHGRVSMLQAAGVPGDLIKEWIGHSNLRTTSRYTHFRDDFRQQVACNVALFAQPSVVRKLPVSPNSPNFASVAAEASAA